MIFDLPFPYAPDSEEPVIPEISDALLKQLFAASEEVLKASPWKKLHDTDWFGIVDPDTGETHIVAIMGAARQFCAVQVYLPDEGIRFWNDFIHNGEPDVTKGRFQQRMLSCEFVSWNEEDLDETDMARNEKFGDERLNVDYLDSFLFRSTLPGQVNWHPTEDESRKLLDALRLVSHFLRKRKKLPQKCYQHEFGDLMPWIPCFRLPDGKDRRQADQWELTTVRFPEAENPDTYLDDEVFPTRVASHPVRKGTTWQIGCIYFEKAVIVDGRPTWLVLSLIAVEESGFALGAELLPCTESLESALRKCFQKALTEAGHRPETLKVGSALAQRVFHEVPGLKLVQEDRLPLFNQIINKFLAQQDEFLEDLPIDGLSSEAMEQINAIMASAPPPDQMSPDTLAGLMDQISKIEGADAIIQKLIQSTASESDPFPGLDDLAPAELESDATKGETRGRKAVETGERFVFRIDLEGFRPPIWRRLSISSGATFAELHDAIQDLFDWEDSHLHSFMKRQGRRVTLSIGPDPNQDDQPEHRTRLSEVFTRKGTKIHYIYDFGDNWSHLIKLEERVASKPADRGPACLAGRGIAPPEDCGGVWGFLSLLDPESDYAEELDWDPEEIRRLREGKFDPKSIVFR